MLQITEYLFLMCFISLFVSLHEYSIKKMSRYLIG